MTKSIQEEHFQRAADEIAECGSNDALPFDIDTKFISDKRDELSSLAFSLFQYLEQLSKKNASDYINSLPIYSERLLTPSGAFGFRIITSIHPFWNIYINGLGIAIAEDLEPRRSSRAYSYRFQPTDAKIFDSRFSWKHYKEATIESLSATPSRSEKVIVQTDISGFYEQIYHHRLENLVQPIFGEHSTVARQLDRILNKFSSGRSFGLPVGGQCSRILAELLLNSMDRRLSEEGIDFYRYVDDFTLICDNQASAYKALSVLSTALADYGLSLNRTKTTTLSERHYVHYVQTQIGLSATDDNANKLKQIDLHFDPYSDNPEADYEELRDTVEKLEVTSLLNLELDKAQPDTFLISQISRTLKLQSPLIAAQLCRTLLSSGNLHSFRASWSTIMRGIYSLRNDSAFSSIHDELDRMVDNVLSHSSHLLVPETNILFFLRVLKCNYSESRAAFVFQEVYRQSNSAIVRRACIECWRQWQSRERFMASVNEMPQLSTYEQQMVWLMSFQFPDEGSHFRKHIKRSMKRSWELGFEDEVPSSYASLFMEWTQSV